jgi:7-cyano-7-deazaguanine synthase
MSGNIDLAGNIPICPEPALVLLSGGLDSVAALGWAQIKHARVRAITYSYGQPHRDAEVSAAQRTAAARGVRWSELALADLFSGGGFLDGVHDHEPDAAISRAFVPGRNLVFLSVALSHAMVMWPDELHLTLVIGCCREDAAAFPDCSEAFVKSAAKTLTEASGRTVRVSAPWARMPKAGIVDYWITQQHDDDMLRLLRESWSCYRGAAAPCMTCTACVLRLKALAANGFREDIARGAKMRGGDVHREKELKGYVG